MVKIIKIFTWHFILFEINIVYLFTYWNYVKYSRKMRAIKILLLQNLKLKT